MDNTLMTIIGIFLAATLIFVIPLMSISERNNDITQSVIQTATVEFVDKISVSGLIKTSDYEEYIQKLNSTGNTYDVEIEVQHLDGNFGKKNATTSKDLIGENERYSTFTTEILENMYLEDGTSQDYVLKKGDNVIVTAKNTNRTMAQTLRAFIYKVTGKGTYEIAAISSSMVVNGETGNVEIATTRPSQTIPEDPVQEYTAYSIGDEVTVGGESFYVIANSDETQEKVTLLAKDNIDTINLVQSATANTVVFSTETYWGNGTSPYDIEEIISIPNSHNAAKAAYVYGDKIGGTGRLLRYNEANALIDANSDILYGTNGKSSRESLNYWLGSAYNSYIVWVASGNTKILRSMTIMNSAGYGVRPVVEISKTKITQQHEYTPYSIGEEVTVGGENFYVIEESDSSTPTVTLLAKYCLNSSGVQENITYYSLGRRFSSENYWSSETEYPVDLNEYLIPEGVTSLITTAKEYGETKGGTGRLMTYEEASKLVTDYAGIIYGTNIGAASGYFYYWLSSAYSDTTVYAVYGAGRGSLHSGTAYNSTMPCGIRPVIEVSKDLVTNVPEEPAYSIGQEVTVGGENFYVIEESGSSESTVTLLAKDCIDTINLLQSATANAVVFSTESYWGSGTSPYNIEETTPIPDSHTVAKAAYDYGVKVGGTGRLMTYEEAIALKTANIDILYGTNGKSSAAISMYWLGTADGSSTVWTAGSGYINGCDIKALDILSSCYVRPVIEISKSNIS